MDTPYCATLFGYRRLATSEVQIGDVPCGGPHPIRLQSMLSTPTSNIEASVNQCIRIIEAGADYVRITTPAMRDVANLAEIKTLLRKKGYSTPLVADVHFNAAIAEEAARVVEKVRINPGNFIPMQDFEKTGANFELGLEAIHRRLLPLIDVCRKYGTALRIGTNHGSLSERIVSRYGDTPEGMAEATLEFVRVLRSENFHNLVISLKSSNTRVMVQAYRLMTARMLAEGYCYPLHLGVTEAGEGEDGRIKSAVGIGSLLADGIGDTIRVSLTEEPEAEIPVARQLRDIFYGREKTPHIKPCDASAYHPFDYKPRNTVTVFERLKKDRPVVVLLPDKEQIRIKTDSKSTGGETLPDFVAYLRDVPTETETMTDILLPFSVWRHNKRPSTYPVYEPEQYLTAPALSPEANFVRLAPEDYSESLAEKLKTDPAAVLLLYSRHKNPVAEMRTFFFQLSAAACQTPVILCRQYCSASPEDFQLKLACDTGPLFIDGFGDGLMIENVSSGKEAPDSATLVQTCFAVLQAARLRATRPEYISCPSCGRTQFNILDTTRRIREKTAHLAGLKIAVMGCIVNGPGEMADADYGYVGGGKGKINLYRNREVVKTGIPEQDAVDELLELIKSDGRWL